MGVITYKPHCSKCGAIINQQVTYNKESIEELTTKTRLYYDKYFVNPNRCECCGEAFEGIKITLPKEIGDYEY